MNETSQEICKIATESDRVEEGSVAEVRILTNAAKRWKEAVEESGYQYPI